MMPQAVSRLLRTRPDGLRQAEVEDRLLYRSAAGIALATIILMQIGNVISRRSASTLGIDMGLFRKRLILLGIAIEITFSWAILYWEPVQSLLHTGPVSSAVYALACCGIPLLLFCDRARKAAKSRKNRTAIWDGLLMHIR
jgi:sodium/potassium-transporting ATPase subunit alpha